jgi:hypothetical protein
LKLEVCRPGFTDRAIAPQHELLATYGSSLFGYDLPHFDYGSETKLAEHISRHISNLAEVRA